MPQRDSLDVSQFSRFHTKKVVVDSDEEDEIAPEVRRSCRCSVGVLSALVSRRRCRTCSGISASPGDRRPLRRQREFEGLGFREAFGHVVLERGPGALFVCVCE